MSLTSRTGSGASARRAGRGEHGGAGGKNESRELRRARRLKRWEPVFYIAPSAVLLAAIFLVPLVDALRYSFTDAMLLSDVANWVGLDNYEALFTARFAGVLGKTVVWVAVSVIGSLFVGFFLALLLERPMRGRTLIRVILVLPWVFPEAIIAVMWQWTLHPGWGLVNNLLLDFGLLDEPMNLLSEDKALATLIVIRIWRGAPFVFLAVLAGLQAIPNEINEAAYVDGASAYQRMRYIKLPLLRPVLWAAGVILAAWTLVIFDLVFIMTGGGPDRSSEILAIRIYEAGFQDFNLGLASAMAMITVLMVTFMSYFYMKRTFEDIK